MQLADLVKPLLANHSRVLNVPTLLGLAIAAMGVMVISGWLMHIQILVEMRHGMVAMTFNTALCFTLTGLALALPGILQRSLDQVQSVVGAYLICLGGLVLSEHALDYDLGIDWAFLHTWLQDGNTRPGRFAPNTAIGFMFIGSSLLLLARIKTRGQELIFQTLVFGVLAIGLTGLVGYLLSPDQLFGWARSARMAVHTAVGMIMVAVALWTSWQRADKLHASRFLRPDEKIGFMSAAILSVVTLTAGMTGFVFQQMVLESSLRDKLQFRLDGQRGIIQSAVEQARVASWHAGHDPHLILPAQRVAGGAADGVTELGAEMNGLIEEGFHSATLRSLSGQLLYRAGNAGDAAGQAALHLPNRGPEQAVLTWNGKLMLHTRIPLVKDGVAFARLELTRPMAQIQFQLFDLRGLGETGEMALCAGDATQLHCLPTGRNPLPYSVRRLNIVGLPLPMSRAVNGAAGLIATYDYRGQSVMAAFTPLAPNLGLVVKQDTTELYSVIRMQLKWVLPALLVLIAFAALLMRGLVQPLLTRLIASETHAREQQLELNTLVASVGEGIMTINEKGLIESYNAAAAHIFGYEVDEVIGQPLDILMPPEMRGPHLQGMRNYLQTGERKVIGRPNAALPGLRKDGSRFTLELTVNEIRYDERRVFVGVVRDISERKLAEEKLIWMAQYDALTGLPNRALFMDRMAAALLRAGRSSGTLALMFLDIDGFKGVNDTLGHHGGDELLKQFGQRLCEAVRKTDTVARLAGDEFTIILEELHAAEQDAQRVAEKIIASMATPFDLAGHTVSISTSIGFAIDNAGKTDLDELIRRADGAMYRAKRRGKNCWCS